MKTTYIGELIRRERERLGISQKELAQKAGMKNYQTLLAIEKGKREIKLSELYRIARSLGLSPSYFLESQERAHPEVLWRKCMDSTECRRLENLLDQYCKNFQNLNKLIGKDYKKFIPPPSTSFKRERYKNEFNFARELAYDLLKNWNLGEYPIRNLIDSLEEEGVLLFTFPLKDTCSAASIIGEFGAAILLNRDNRPWRIAFDIAHELFHLITWNLYEHSEIYDDEERGKSIIEKYADTFAATLLMPENKLKEEFEKAEVGGKVSREDFAEIACKFGVSIDALTYRLKDLRLFDPEILEAIRNDIELKKYFQQIYTRDYDYISKKIKQLPREYVRVAVKAYIAEKISKMKLAEYLGKKVGELEHFLVKEYNLSLKGEMNIAYHPARC